MAYRGTESPMDFEWQGHGTGPIDTSSPFHRFTMKRTHSQLDGSLGKGSLPLLPSLAEPNGRPWFFSNMPVSPAPTQTQTQMSPFRSPSFTTPRKPFDIDFSSGPESSPADQPAQNDDTPDSKPFEFKSNNSNNGNLIDSSAAKSGGKRNSLFGMYGKFAPSPSAQRKPFNDALERRIHKQEHEEGLLTRIFAFLTTYPSAPAIIAKYLQILSNVFIFMCVFYLLYSAVSTIRSDIDRLADETVSEILAEMSTCSKNYVENRCAADTRLPALETVCSNWEICMQRDPNAVKRARLSAHTLADILNGFVEPISWKTMGVMFAGLVLVLLVTNGTFTLYRRQYEQSHHLLHHGEQMDNDTDAADIDQARRLVEWRRNANGSPSKRFRATPSPEKKKPRI
ncbi:hypothetical protein DV736_g4666, partial [Chaetothyriales sp. CBS 134916]